MKYRIAVLPGDGIGPEVMAEAILVLKEVGLQFGHEFELYEGLIGGAAYDHYKNHLPEDTLKLAKDCDAILFGSVGGPISEAALPKWANCEKNSLLGIRKAFSFHANFRPARVYPALQSRCPLKPELISEGIDLLIIRELLGDLYFGLHETTGNPGERVARDVAEYTEEQISKIAHTAFQAASKRGKTLCSVDKANVLDTSKLWRTVLDETASEYPEVTLSHMLVDNCAMQLIQNPSQFDVIVTSNMFGDILSDAAAVLPGSLGLTPSASLNIEGFGMYEPSGGSAPNIAGKGIANPTAQILCVAMMLKFSFGLAKEAIAIENAVEQVLDGGARTGDIALPDEKVLGTREFGVKIREALRS